jgi:hypothetical protein
MTITPMALRIKEQGRPVGYHSQRSLSLFRRTLPLKYGEQPRS